MGHSIWESNFRIPMGHASQPLMGLRTLNHLPLTCLKIATFYWNIAIIEHSRGLSLNSLCLFSKFHLSSKFPQHLFWSPLRSCVWFWKELTKRKNVEVKKHANLHDIAILSITSADWAFGFLEGADPGGYSYLSRENEQHRVMTSPDLDETIRTTNVTE